MSGPWILIGVAAVMLLVIGGIAFLSQQYTLDNIKSKTVGDGQHGTARWATKKEIQKPFLMSRSVRTNGALVKTFLRYRGLSSEVLEKRML